jgi:hypothetical protein
MTLLTFSVVERSYLHAVEENGCNFLNNLLFQHTRIVFINNFNWDRSRITIKILVDLNLSPIMTLFVG